MRITQLEVGWITSPAGIWRRDEPLDRQLRFPIPAYLIETDSERILVDTGLHPDAVEQRERRYGSAEALGPVELEQERSVAEQIDLATVTRVVLTHLHYDHAGGLDLLPATVPVIVQRREWEAAHDEQAVARNFLQPCDYAAIADRVMLVDGDHDLLGDGSVELLSTPGHTPGHQSVRVGDLVLGADVTHFAAGLDDHRFPLFGHDLDEQGRSAERLRALRDAGLTVLPGHDPDVLRPGPVQAA
jgi:glyoxylase-like metal-dependent hydrolase (beta-lactamase superfamily II)